MDLDHSELILIGCYQRPDILGATPILIEDRSGDFQSGEFLINDTYDLDPGQNMRLAVVARDSLGLTHCVVVHELTASDDEQYKYRQEIIIDSKGEVLVGPDDFRLAY